MKLEDQVTSIELSKKLKELGIKQESLFYYIDSKIYINHQTHWPDPENIKTHISAFTASELLEILPDSITIYKSTDGEFLWFVELDDINENKNIIDNINLSNALANMLIYLIENKLMEIK